jgi:hypothetical protein
MPSMIGWIARHSLKFPASRKGGGMVDAPGRRVVGAKGKFAIVTNSADVFSPGEQRLAFARLPVNRPRYAFYIPFLSSSHRPTALKFHRNVPDLSPDPSSRIEPSSQFALASAA